MNEHAPHQPETSALLLAKSAIIGTLERAYVAGGTVLGAWAANHFAPPTVTVAPDIELRVSLAREPGISASLGPLADLNLPNASVDTSLPYYEGVRLDPTKLAPLTNDGAGENYLALFSNYQSSIVEPVREELLNRLALGAGGGALLSSIAFLHLRHHVGLIKYKRQRQQQDLAAQPHNTPHERKHFHAPRWTRKAVAALAITSTLLTSTTAASAVYHGVKELSNPETEESTLLPPQVTDQNPILEGARISGMLRDLPRTTIDILLEKQKSIDSSLQKRATNFAKEYRTFTHENEAYRDLRANPNIKSLLHTSDFHCNRAFAEFVWGRVIEEVRPDIILDTGDIHITRGSTPVEKDCIDMLTSRIGLIPFATVDGNHDNNMHNPNIINVGQEGHVEIDGLHFVGVPDPEETKFTATPEGEKYELDHAIAKRSKELAKHADSASKESKGIRPIALAHREMLLSDVTTGGKVLLGLSGHTHRDGGVHRYRSSGPTVFQHTAASIIGAKESFTYYSDLVQDASFMEILYDTDTDQIAGFVRYTLNKEDHTASVTFIPTPIETTEPIAMQEFQTEFASK